MPADKNKEAFIHRDDNTPLKEYLVRSVRLVRSPASGTAIGFAQASLFGNLKIVSFQNGVWYEIDELPKGAGGRDVWLGCEGTSPKFLVLVSDEGYVLAHTIKGQIGKSSAATDASRIYLKTW